MSPLIFDSSSRFALRRYLETIFDRDRAFIFPTETFYALGCVADRPNAIESIYEIKGRSPMTPLPVLLDSWHMFAELCPDLRQATKRYLRQFWPGGLTGIFPTQYPFAKFLNKNDASLGVRLTSHPPALDLIDMMGAPLVGTSANLSGHPPASTLAEIDPAVRQRCSFVLDGGTLNGEVATTLVDFRAADRWKVVRQGTITVETLSAALQKLKAQERTRDMFAKITLESNHT